MCESPNPQHGRGDTIQDQWEKAQERYSPLRAVIDSPDVPPRGKLLVTLSWLSLIGVASLGISKAPIEAYGAMVVCTLAIAILIYQIREPTNRDGRPRPRPAKPRP